MKKLLLLLAVIFATFNGNAQLHEDFSGGTVTPYLISNNIGTEYYGDIPSTWTEHNVDGYNLIGIWNPPFVGKGWRTHVLTDFGLDTVAIAASIFGLGSTVSANDWLITPQFTVPTVSGTDKVYLLWEGYATTNTGEAYDVHISTGGNSVADFNNIVYTETSENNTEFKLHAVDISSYSGQSIYAAFNYNPTANYFLCIDDVQTKVVTGYDAEIRNVKLNRYQKTNGSQQITGEIMNWGPAITQIDIEWNDGSGPQTMTLNNINIPQFDHLDFTHNIPFNNSAVGEYTISVTPKNINTNQTDTDPSNDMDETVVSTVSATPQRNILLEELTGTWCAWCVRGIVLFDLIDNTVTDGSIIPIAVHTQSNDPMTVLEYSKGTKLRGAPSCNLDRHADYYDVDVHPSITMNAITSKKGRVTPAEVSQTVAIDINSREITINANATFHTDISTGLRFASILVEDSLTGTTTDWAQANAYAGGNYGAMGGFENEPNLIPASTMVYDHVGRHLIGGYDGEAGSIQNSVSTNGSAAHTFKYTVPAKYDIDHLKVVTIVVDETDGQVLNATSNYVVPTSTKEIVKTNFDFSVYPNPTSNGNLNIDIQQEVQSNKNYAIEVFNLEGKLVYSQHENTYGSKKVSVQLPSKLSNGEYLLNITSENSTIVKPILLRR